MKTINKQSENMGGVLRLWAVPPGDISLSGDQVNILCDDNIINILVREDSASFDEDLARSFAGSAYKVEIKATIPCDTAGTLALISELERKNRYQVIYLDGNGNYKLAGTSEVPLKFIAKATTGNTSASLNRYDLTFSGLLKQRALIIQNPFE